MPILARWESDDDDESEPETGQKQAWRYDTSSNEEHLACNPEESTSQSGEHDSSDASTDSELSSSDESHDHGDTPPEVSLSLHRLQSLHANDSGQCSSYAERGKSVSRCKHVLPPFEDFGGNLQCFLELVQALPGFTVVVHPVGIRPWFEEECMIDQSEKKLREDLLEKLIDNKLTGPTLQISFHCNPDQLPEKKLPHGNWASLYVLYRAYADVQGEEAAGKSVFYRVARKWKACLSLYQQNQPKDFAQQAVLSAQLLSHYSAQWKDRQIYWMTRTRSRTERDILSNIIDSFDHSKVMLPRFPGKRTPKSSVYDSLKRALHALVHDWGKIMPSDVHLWNAYKDRKQQPGQPQMKVPQQFTFIRRSDMPSHGHLMPTEERLPTRLRNCSELNDVFCLTKLRMSDEYLCQDPLLVFPHGLCGATRHFWSRISSPDSVLPLLHPSLDEGRCQELDALGKQLVTDFPHFQRTAAYYQKLANQSFDRRPPRRFQFVNAGPTADQRIGQVTLGAEPVAPKPHKLKVTFRRRPD
ncbi:unnamed protein product [Durusdinium trenchii]|uniref:Uncharacterized protein n=1 Tax=Durusdinium trenchii TaxID=1381693 RepID=A0ABP0PEB4_9DINO